MMSMCCRIFLNLVFFLMLAVHLYQQVVKCKVEELNFVLLRFTVVPELHICIASSEQNRAEQNRTQQNSVYDRLEQNISAGRDLNHHPVQLPKKFRPDQILTPVIKGIMQMALRH